MAFLKANSRSLASSACHPRLAAPTNLPLAPRSCVQGLTSKASASALGPGLDVLRTSRPIDRLRYQAKLVFDNFDADGDGKLSPAELRQYIQHSEARLGASPELSQQYAALESSVSARGPGAQAADYEEFVDLVRGQVATLKQSKDWVAAQLPGRELTRLLYKAALTIPELSAALVTFRLLDQDGSGLLKLQELQKAQGIEKQVVEDVLEDADADDDGFLTFEDFLASYQKKRPVFMAMAIMAAHTASFWFIFQLPVDTTVKAMMAGLLLLRPQLLTGPIMKIWAIGKTVWGRILATREMAGRGANWSSFA